MKRNIALKVFTGLMSLFLLTSCQSAKNPYQISITQNQQVIKTYSLEMIQKMPVKSFAKDGKIESGPSVAVLLEDLGIKDFSKLTFKNGSGETFQVINPENFILDITNRGTCKLASEKLSKEQWLKDITEIEIETEP